MASFAAAGGLLRNWFFLVLAGAISVSALNDMSRLNRQQVSEGAWPGHSSPRRPHSWSRIQAKKQQFVQAPAPTAAPAAASGTAPVPAPPAATTAAPTAAAAAAAPAPAPAGAVTAAPVAAVATTVAPAAGTTTAAAVTEYQCASETPTNSNGDCPECTLNRTCTCNGWAKLGYGDKWSPWYQSSSSVECGVGAVFAEDPYPNHTKICMCTYSLATEDFWSQPTNLGMWWPIGLVAIPASLIILVLTCARWSNQVNKLAPGPVELSLEAAVPTVLFFAPMVCVVYVAAAKRAEALLDTTVSLLQEGHQIGGSPDLEGTNHLLVERCIQISAVAFLFQMWSRIMFEWHAVRDVHERSVYDAEKSNRKVQFWVNVYHLAVVVAGIAVAVLLVRLDVFMGEARLSTIMDRIVGLAVPYFACYYSLHFCTFFSGTHAFAMALSKLACLNMNFAPMLCVLFLGIQVSADDNIKAGASSSEHPSVRAEGWVIWTTGTVIFQTLMSVLTPLCFGAQLKETPRAGEEDLMVHRDFLLLLINLVRWVAMAILYIGVCCLCQELWAENAIPPRAHVLSFLAGVYFIIYGLMWATMTARQLLDGGDFRQCLRQLIVMKDLVAICPMVGAFFLGWWVVNE